jgi:hypothetical protein
MCTEAVWVEENTTYVDVQQIVKQLGKVLPKKKHPKLVTFVRPTGLTVFLALKFQIPLLATQSDQKKGNSNADQLAQLLF